MPLTFTAVVVNLSAFCWVFVCENTGFAEAVNMRMAAANDMKKFILLSLRFNKKQSGADNHGAGFWWIVNQALAVAKSQVKTAIGRLH